MQQHLLNPTKIVFCLIWLTYASISLALFYLTSSPNFVEALTLKREDPCLVLIDYDNVIFGKCLEDGPSNCTCSEGLFTIREAFWTCNALVNPTQDNGGLFQEAVLANQVCKTDFKTTGPCEEEEGWTCLEQWIGQGFKMPITVVTVPTVGPTLNVEEWNKETCPGDGVAMLTELSSVSISPEGFLYPIWSCFGVAEDVKIVTIQVTFPKRQPPLPTSSATCFSKNGECYTMSLKCCHLLVDYVNDLNSDKVSSGYSAMDQTTDCTQSLGLSDEECLGVRRLYSIE